MRNNEIMMGDWIEFKGRVAQVDNIWRENHVGIQLKSGGCLPVDLDRIDPIPITPEILEKNGFKEATNIFDEDEFGDWSFGEVGTNNEFDSIYLSKITFNTAKHKWRLKMSVYGRTSSTLFIDDVHELQHALRLANIEKEIIL